MRHNKVIYTFMAIVLLNINAARAQKPVSDSVIVAMLQHAQSQLMNSRDYRYNIFYRYSNESSPTITLDSLNGFLESDSGNYHLRLGNTEMVMNDKYSLSIFNEDKIIYLTKSKKDSVKANPLLQFNSLVKAFPLMQGTVSISKKDTVLNIRFPDSSWYKSISFYINGQSHLITKVAYIIKTEALTETGSLDKESQKKYDLYARVEALFTKFQINTQNMNDYNPANYIKREGNNFIGVEDYSQYKIIIGSPDL